MDDRWVDVPSTPDTRWEDVPSTPTPPVTAMSENDRWVDVPSAANVAADTIKKLFSTTGKAIQGHPEAVSDIATEANKVVKPFYQPIPLIQKMKENMQKSIPGKGLPSEIGRTALDFTIPTSPVDVGMTALGTGMIERGVNTLKPFARTIGDLLREKRATMPAKAPETPILDKIIPKTASGTQEEQLKAIIEQNGGKYVGIQQGIPADASGPAYPAHVLFNEPSGSTLALQIDKVTPEAIKSRIAGFGKKVKPETQFTFGRKIQDEPLPGQTRLKSYPQTIKNSQQTPLELADKLGGEYTVKPNAAMLARAQESIKTNPDEALNRVLSEKATDENVALAGELIKHYNSKNNFDISQKIIDTLDPQLREAGRTIQAVSLYNNLTPEGVVGFAQRRLSKVAEKFPNWAPKLKIDKVRADELRTMSENIQKMPDGEEKLIALNDLNQKINSYIPSKIADKAIAIWKAGLLTGIKTTGGNILSNTTNAITENISKTAAVPYDMAISLLSGKRSVTTSGEGYLKGFKEGIHRGATFFKTGFDPRRGDPMMKYDQLQVNFDSPVLKKYVNISFRNMGAQDQPFYYGALRSSIVEQTKVAGINKGLSGKSLDAYVKKNLEAGKIPENIIKNATKDAEIAVYTNETQLGNIGKAIQRSGPVGQFVIPFAKTPAAVATQVINYTPAGALKPILDGLMSGIGKGAFNQRELSLALGRVTTGAPILYLGKKLYEKGRITLGMPKSEREREQMELEGKTPNSIRVGDRNYSLNYLGPAGNLILIGAYFQKGLQETGSKTQALAQSVAGAGKSVVDQTFLQGLSGVLEAVNDPTRFGEYMLSSTAGSVVPTLVGDIAKATDKSQRVTRDKQDLLKSIKMSVQSRVPAAREALPVKYNIFGKDLKRPSGSAATMIDVTRSTPVLNQEDKTVQELSSLAKNPDTISTPTEIKPKQTVAGKEIQIPTEALYDINKHVGMEIKKTFDDFNQNPNYSRLYQNMSPEQKSLIYNNISANIKAVNVIKYAMSKNLLTRKEGTYELLKLAGGDKSKFINFLSGNYFVPLDIIKLISKDRVIKQNLTGKVK